MDFGEIVKIISYAYMNFVLTKKRFIRRSCRPQPRGIEKDGDSALVYPKKRLVYTNFYNSSRYARKIAGIVTRFYPDFGVVCARDYSV